MSWLADLIADAVEDVTRTGDATIHAIDAALNRAAVGLLQAIPPPMVESAFVLVRTENGVALGGAGALVDLTLGTADVGLVLSGSVEKAVTEELGRLTSGADYAQGVRSVAS